MALDTYDNLKAAIQSWCGEDPNVAGSAGDFIALAEADFNNGVRLQDGTSLALRTREMETVAIVTMTSGVGTLPADYLEWRQVSSNNSPTRGLQFVAPSGFDALYGDLTAGLPNHFTIIGSSIYIRPVSSTDLSLVYYGKVSALSDSNTSNWLLAKAPNAYLFGALYHAALWNKLYEEEAAYFNRFTAQIVSLNSADFGARWARTAAINTGCNP